MEEKRGEGSGGREGGRTGSLLQRAEKEGKEGRDNIKANVSTGLDSRRVRERRRGDWPKDAGVKMGEESESEGEV